MGKKVAKAQASAPAAGAVAKSAPASIYHKSSGDKGGKKRLVWADQTQKGSLVASVHKYQAPWSLDRTNWWQRGDPDEVTGSWSAIIPPGKAHRYMIQSALRQTIRINQVSACSEPKAAKGGKPGFGVVKIHFTQTDGLVHGAEPMTTTAIGAVVQQGCTQKSRLRLLAGDYVFTNTGTVPVSVHGTLESLYIPMK